MGPEPLVSAQAMIDLFEATLEKPGWIDNKVQDQFPSAGSKSALGVPLLGRGGWKGNGNPGKKHRLTKSLEGNQEQLMVKQIKGG